MATTTLLFADQVASTAQLAALGDTAAVRVRTTLIEAILLAIADHGGRIVDLTGDGVFAAFDGAGDALDAATTVQGAVALGNRAVPPDEQAAVRIGVHTGEPLVDERGGLFGIAVVVARRLCDEAGAGQTLVSGLTRALVEPRREHRTTPLGPRSLKGIEGEVDVAELVWEPPRLPTTLPAGTTGPTGGDPDEAAETETGSLVPDGLAQRWQRTVAGDGDGGGLVVLVGDATATRRAIHGLAALVADDGGMAVAATATADPVPAVADAVAEGLPAPLLRLLAGTRAQVTALGECSPEVARRLHVNLAIGHVPDPATERSVVGALLTRVGAVAPVVVVVPGTPARSPDHVADLASLRSVLRGTRVLLVVDGSPGVEGDDATSALATFAVDTLLVGDGRPAARPNPVATAPAPGATTRFAGPSPEPAVLELPDGTSVALLVAGTTIGRLDTADVCVHDADVSRRHAVIRGVGPAWIIEDLQSTNGTLVNGAPIRDHVLVDGDEIQVGSTTLRYRAAPRP